MSTKAKSYLLGHRIVGLYAVVRGMVVIQGRQQLKNNGDRECKKEGEERR